MCIQNWIPGHDVVVDEAGGPVFVGCEQVVVLQLDLWQGLVDADIVRVRQQIWPVQRPGV